MKILITGANGLLGTYLVRDLMQAGHEVLATGLGPARLHETISGRGIEYNEMDIRDPMAIRRVLEAWKPEWVLHNAAWAQPDSCETQPAACWDVNVTATRFLLDAAKDAGAAFLFVSTDFVFDGKAGPYREDDATGPVNYYGCSKMVAEKAVRESGLHWAIVRTVLVYGQSPTVQRFNLLSWVRDKLTAGERIRVVNDQYRTPTYAGDLAKGIRLVMEKNIPGIFHISGADFMTPYDMAVATARALHLDETLIDAVHAGTFSQPAQRPARTGFIIEKARRMLGYEPLSFTEGLLKMFQHDAA